jgi:hypothetical protein
MSVMSLALGAYGFVASHWQCYSTSVGNWLAGFPDRTCQFALVCQVHALVHSCVRQLDCLASLHMNGPELTAGASS